MLSLTTMRGMKIKKGALIDGQSAFLKGKIHYANKYLLCVIYVYIASGLSGFQNSVLKANQLTNRPLLISNKACSISSAVFMTMAS